MKKILLVLMALLFFGCDNIYDMVYSEKYSDMSLYYTSEWDNITTRYAVSIWIRSNVEYKADTFDFAQSPKTTYTRRYGDCEDFALLYINMLYTCCGVKSDLIVLDDTKIRTIVNGGSTNHVMVLLDNKIIEPQDGTTLPDKYSMENVVGYLYSFSTIFGVQN